MQVWSCSICDRLQPYKKNTHSNRIRRLFLQESCGLLWNARADDGRNENEQAINSCNFHDNGGRTGHGADPRFRSHSA